MLTLNCGFCDFDFLEGSVVRTQTMAHARRTCGGRLLTDARARDRQLLPQVPLTDAKFVGSEIILVSH